MRLVYVLEQGKWPEDTGIMGVYATLDGAKAGVVGTVVSEWRRQGPKGEGDEVAELDSGEFATISGWTVEDA